LFSIIPGFKLMVERFYQIIGDVILKAFNSNVFNTVTEQRLNRYFVSTKRKLRYRKGFLGF